MNPFTYGVIRSGILESSFCLFVQPGEKYSLAFEAADQVSIFNLLNLVWIRMERSSILKVLKVFVTLILERCFPASLLETL